jgi:NHL repeat-containing protein
MRHQTQLSVAIGVAASLGLLTACSGGSTIPSTALPIPGALSQSPLRAQIPKQTTSASHTAGGTLIYVCGSDKCLWYPAGSDTPAGTITGLHPSGIGIDQNGRVYIADSNANAVLIYAKGSQTLLKTLVGSPGQKPAGVAIDIDGTVYVANNAVIDGNKGSVSVYAHGSTNPTSYVSDPNFGSVVSLALDENHTLYVCYAAGPDGKCDKFPHAKGHGINAISFHGIPTGVATDARENVVVNNGLGSTSVYSGANLTLCNTIQEAGFPDGLAFDKTHGDLFVVHYFNASVTEEKYPGCVGAASLEFTYKTGWSSSVPPHSVAID